MWNEDDIVIGEDAAIDEAFDKGFEEPDLIDPLEFDLGQVTDQVWSESSAMQQRPKSKRPAGFLLRAQFGCR